MAIEVIVGDERLITAGGATGQPGARLTPAGSTASVAEGSIGAVLGGVRARALGPRLTGGVERVEVRRNAEADDTLWVELSHRGWVERHGFLHERRLFVDVQADELRGEDRFAPAGGQPAQTPYTVRFHLAEGVEAASAGDGRSVRLLTPGGQCWRLRHDAEGAALEASAVALKGQVRPQGGARLRWKLSPDVGAG
jgi:uncharacterized heparinase superfamily protein